MTLLEQFLASTNMDPTQAMNALQECGIVSDNAITAADVADADFIKARDFLWDWI